LKVASFIVARLSVLPESAPASRRWPFFVAAVAVVAALHAWLLFGLAPAWIDPEEPPAAAPALAVRSVTLPAAAPVAPPVAVETAPAPRVAPPKPKLARAVPVQLAASVPEPAAPPPTPPPAAETAALPPAATAPVATIEPVAPAAVIDVPVYPTRLPAAGVWRYELTRGIASGQAQLSWRPDEQQRYTLQLEGFIAGISVLEWVSRGAMDHAGIAPERFVIRRRGRDNQAANFQRDAGKVTWSGPTHEVPLVAGVQDRLSWMLQLPAVIEAAPQRFAAGANVVLMVIGARGGADVWTFNVVGPEPVGQTAALKLVRQARKPRDVQVEVWLDPARGHLPLRALLTQPDGGAPLELVLETRSTGP
jgi:Protein of unknown function (DUF3108)